MTKNTYESTKKTNEYSFLSSLSHEVRTPMNAIQGLSEILLFKIKEPEEREYVRSMQSATQNLLMAINSVTDYDDIINGRITYTRENFKIRELISSVLEMIRINVGDKNVVVVCDVNPELPEVIKGDPQRLKQVLVYYLTAASRVAKYANIVLLVDYSDKEEKFIRFSVENTVSESPIMKDIVAFMDSELIIKESETENLNIYFDIRAEKGDSDEEKPYTAAFAAVYLSDKREADVIKRALKALKISVKIIDNPSELFLFKEKERPTHLILEENNYRKLKNVEEFMNLGIKLICVANPMKELLREEIPIVIRRPVFYPELIDILNEAEDKEKTILDLKNARILVVDDNAINLKVSEGLLKPYGAAVDTAAGGEDAVRMVHKTKYDLVLMDHMMPDMDGTEATGIIRSSEDEYFKKLPIVALSANVMLESRETFTKAGMNDFLAKPIDIEKLEAMLKKWIPKEKQGLSYRKDISALDDIELNPDEFKCINIMDGLKFTGGNAPMYKGIITDFYEASESKQKLLSKLLEAEDVGRYTIEVHSLKSLSRTIGANVLSEKAEMLEKLGHHRDLEGIREGHGDLIEEFSKVSKELERVAVRDEKEEERVPLLREKAGIALKELFHAMENFDYDKAENILTELGQYKYDELTEDVYRDLKEAVENIDYDVIKEKAIEMLVLL